MEPTQGGVVNENGLDAVVKVFAATMSPNYSFPWQMKPQILKRTGSGFVISGRKILTNAHVVTGQISLSVRKRGAPIKYKAEVQAVGHECDLALLMVSDPKFWEGMNFLEFGDIPCLGARVTVVGYPCGGDNISVTSGVVSRVDLSQYTHGAANLIAIQVDAAINAGNSGGPAIVNEKVVGVAFQTLPTATNIGYIIPVLVIEHFLADVIEHGKYIGFCTLGVSYEPTENKQLRDYLKMPPELTGVRVSKINPLCDSHNMLKKDDVIIAFDDIPVASDGTATFREGERIMFDHFVSIKKAGETGAVRVLRDGVKHEFQIKLGPSKPLVPICEFDKSPSYFIFGGLVFTPLTVHYIRECGDNWNSILPHRLCQRALTEFPQKNGEQIIILSQVLIDDISTGYQHLSGFQVKKVNEVVVDNLKHLHQLVECCREENLRFDLDDGRVIVLNFKNARDAAFRILKQHGISSAMSPDLEKDPMQDKLECEDEDEDAAFPILKQHGISSAMSPDLEKDPMQEKLKCEDEDEDECEDEDDEDEDENECEDEDDEDEDAAFPILKQHGISSAMSPDLEKDPMQLKCEDEDEDECEDEDEDEDAAFPILKIRAIYSAMSPDLEKDPMQEKLKCEDEDQCEDEDENEERAEILKRLLRLSLYCR